MQLEVYILGEEFCSLVLICYMKICNAMTVESFCGFVPLLFKVIKVMVQEQCGNSSTKNIFIMFAEFRRVCCKVQKSFYSIMKKQHIFLA